MRVNTVIAFQGQQRVLRAGCVLGAMAPMKSLPWAESGAGTVSPGGASRRAVV